ncbi:MAG TPA: hypothetical protein VHV49_11040 [Pseudonocardiaceae bacterium]|jgi:hypothetical protein|nr:hypothetical protein [Pseudonocardiaceae bacterium]
MSDGFTVSGLDQVAALVGGGAEGLGGMAGNGPSVPDAGASSAAVAGVLAALSGVAGSIVTTAGTAHAYVRAGHDAYRTVDGDSARAFQAGAR